MDLKDPLVPTLYIYKKSTRTTELPKHCTGVWRCFLTTEFSNLQRISMPPFCPVFLFNQSPSYSHLQSPADECNVAATVEHVALSGVYSKVKLNRVRLLFENLSSQSHVKLLALKKHQPQMDFSIPLEGSEVTDCLHTNWSPKSYLPKPRGCPPIRTIFQSSPDALVNNKLLGNL